MAFVNLFCKLRFFRFPSIENNIKIVEMGSTQGNCHSDTAAKDDIVVR